MVWMDQSRCCEGNRWGQVMQLYARVLPSRKGPALWCCALLQPPAQRAGSWAMLCLGAVGTPSRSCQLPALTGRQQPLLGTPSLCWTDCSWLLFCTSARIFGPSLVWRSCMSCS
jgi:hypothetical protein